MTEQEQKAPAAKKEEEEYDDVYEDDGEEEAYSGNGDSASVTGAPRSSGDGVKSAGRSGKEDYSEPSEVRF